MKKIWIIAGGVVLAAGLSAPWAVGKLTEQHWQSATSGFNSSQPYFVLETGQYERGYLGATASGQLYAIDPDTGQRHPIDWTGDVSHGVTSSTIDFEFDFPAGAGVDAVFPDEKPSLTVTTSAWGSSVLELNVPSINYTDEDTGESLNMSESYGILTIRDDGDTLEGEMQWPGMVLRSPDLRISLENFSLDQRATRLTGKLWTGEAQASLAKVSVAAREEPEVVLDNLELVSESEADDAGEQFGFNTRVILESLRQGEKNYGPHSLEFGFEDVGVAAWNDMLEAAGNLQELSANPAEDQHSAFQQQMQATMAFSASLESLLAGGLSSTATWDLSSPEGPVTGRARLAHPEQPDGEPVSLMMVAQTIEGEMQLRLPVALAERYPELGTELAPLVAQGVLVEEGDAYVMDASLKDMMVNLNGNEMPLSAMGGHQL
ncbi:MAG: DUF945 family protein [Marinobacter sp.]